MQKIKKLKRYLKKYGCVEKCIIINLKNVKLRDTFPKLDVFFFFVIIFK